ncbi:MAG: STAS domain-containing protein [Candidatus Aquicultor sp.]
MNDSEEQFQLRISIKSTDGIPLVALDGECDAFTASFAHAAMDSLTSEGYKGIVVDISKLVFLDVAGFHALDDCCRHMSEVGGKLLLINPEEQVEDIYNILREKESCALVKSLDEAMAILTSPDGD